MKQFFLFSLAVLLFAACGNNDDDVDQGAIDQELIDQYVIDNNLNTEVHSSGLHYIVEEEGSGDSPTVNSTVTVNYKGYLLDGSVFDQNPPGQPLTRPLRELIPGWQIGLPFIMEGGECTLIVPSSLGYRSQPLPGIPANSVLVFEIELIEVN